MKRAGRIQELKSTVICNNPVIWQSEKAVRMKKCDLFNVQEQIGSNRLGISAICWHYDAGNKPYCPL